MLVIYEQISKLKTVLIDSQPEECSVCHILHKAACV